VPKYIPWQCLIYQHRQSQWLELGAKETALKRVQHSTEELHNNKVKEV